MPLQNGCPLDLSIIIVNYNVKYFLEQCLYSVRAGSAGLRVETIVVDNHSADGSLAYLKPKFQEVRFLINEENRGFAQASNAGLAVASGRHILFLNPDTILAEDTLAICIRFLEAHANCGALGVKMVDGSGRFLKESKRAFPSPITSFYKLIGLSALFPHSKVFSRYHLGHLDKASNSTVDVLAGAFMMVKKEVLDAVGSFDETFFMYGEDVDLSYRIQKGGYQNYYLADTVIIHFKGESTRRGSLNYVRMFYKAMSIFVRKHYSGTKAGLFHILIQAAIRLRAGVTALGKAVRWIRLPVIDALLILTAFWIIKETWVNYVRTDVSFKEGLFLLSFPAFTVLYLVTAYYAGLYDRYYRSAYLLRAMAVATLLLLSGYALLPEAVRFSRGIVVFGAALAFVLIYCLRLILVRSGALHETGAVAKPNILIAGTQQEAKAVTALLHKAKLAGAVAGRLAVGPDEEDSIAPVSDLEAAAEAMEAKEIIFCAGRLSYKEIISIVQQFSDRYKARFYACGSQSIISSDESVSRGEAVAEGAGFAIARPDNRRLKRLIDASIALFWILTFPLHLLFQKAPGRFFANCFAVLTGRKTWVGYSLPGRDLPPVRKSIIGPNGLPSSFQKLSANSLHKLDYWYARNYSPLGEVRLIFRQYKYLSA